MGSLADDTQVYLLKLEQDNERLKEVEKQHKKYVGDLLKELDSKDKKIQALLSNDPHKLRKLGII